MCKAKALGFRYAITIDSDGQHFASNIPAFIEAIEQDPDTFIVGARNLSSDNMPGENTFANKFSNLWSTLETGVKLQDTQSHVRPFQDFTRISILNIVLVLVTFLWIYPRNFLRKLTWTNAKRFFSEHITRSKESNLKRTLATMLGIFMGITLVWGYQMLITLFL